jgi:hypothetical protein
LPVRCAMTMPSSIKNAALAVLTSSFERDFLKIFTINKNCHFKTVKYSIKFA